LNHHSNPKFGPINRVALMLLVLLTHAGVSPAIGLGGINVQSRMGQPFSADIELINVTRDDLAALKVNLAPPAAYEAANLRFDPALNSLRLSVERRPNGTPYIRATSLRRVSEPYLDVLVELTSQDGKLQRAYAALLDMPDAPAAATAPAAPVAAVPAPKAEVTAPRAPAPPRAPRQRAADAVEAVVPAPAGAVRAPAAPATAVPAARAPLTPAAPGKNVLAQAAPKSAEPVRPEPAKPVAPPPEPAAVEQPRADLPKPVLGVPADKGVVTEPPPPPPPPADKKPIAPPPPPPSSPPAGGSDNASNQGLLLGGAALALLAGIGGLWAWRRRSAAHAEPALHPETPARQATVAVAVADAARPSTPAPVAAEPYEFTRPEPTVASVTDNVDPLDEAKVHLEYGQRERAETILREALSKQPGREDIQLLLLEVLAGRGDTDGFNQLAGRVHKQTGGLGDHWKQVMAMGYALDPGYPLYSPTDEVSAFTAPGPFNTPPAPESFNAAADLRLDDDNANTDMDKTMILVRPGARPTAPAPAIAPLPDMNFELPSAAAPSAEAIPDTTAVAPRVPDLPGLDFKVDLPGIALPPDDVAGTADTPADSGLQHEEVQKKIMLARAYREMGDKEGALELLREVEREGDSTQLAEMREILQTLA